MSWNYDVSRERIKKHIANLGEIEIEKLVRDADLYTLLSETKCREILGAHVYINVSNFAKLATKVGSDNYRRVIQAVHLYQREVARIVEGEGIFDGVRIHFQGPKLHALFYRPIDSRQKLAALAVLLQAVLRQFVRYVFNPAFPAVNNLVISGGADIGTAIGTQDGMKGDRELLFLGAPANHAAKIIAGPGSLRMTAGLYAELPEELQAFCIEEDSGDFSLADFDESTLCDLLSAAGIDWGSYGSAGRVEDDKSMFPLKDISYSDAEDGIDLDSLGITNNERVTAASLFADVDGFTRYIGATQTHDAKKQALRVLHAIRKEMAAVVKQDFDGLRIQYQGDRVQALFHLPQNDPEAIVAKTVKAAIGLQSSMEYTLKEILPEACPLRLAIGIDLDTTLVSKLGTRGQRDRICIGMGVERAAAFQEKCAGGEIGFASTVYELLDEHTRQFFNLDKNRGIYVASGLTADKTEARRSLAAYSAGNPVFVRSGASVVSVGGYGGTSARQVLPSKSYAH